MTEKRQDGFHTVDTVMHSLSLSDTLTVSVAPKSVSSVTLRVVGNDRLVTDEKNLAVRAAKLFLEAAAITAEVNIKLEKRIPVAAGLGGGSSDAAATLRALNRLFDRYFTDRALRDIALRLGSDIPYCLSGGTARCQGRGEIITRLPDLSLHAVIGISGEYVSTPRAYAALDEEYSDFSDVERVGGLTEQTLNSLRRGILKSDGVYNVFEKIAPSVCPLSIKIKERLKELGAKYASMSGSGPSVFGIFESEEAARRATEVLSGENIQAYCAKSV